MGNPDASRFFHRVVVFDTRASEPHASAAPWSCTGSDAPILLVSPVGCSQSTRTSSIGVLGHSGDKSRRWHCIVHRQRCGKNLPWPTSSPVGLDPERRSGHTAEATLRRGGAGVRERTPNRIPGLRGLPPVASVYSHSLHDVRGSLQRPRGLGHRFGHFHHPLLTSPIKGEGRSC